MSIVLRVAMGVSRKMTPALEMHGGWLGEESKAFGRSLLNCMHFCKRKGTKIAKKIPDNVEDLMSAFIASIETTMETLKIPKDMTVNLDQTSLPYIPVSEWTMDAIDAKQGPIPGLDDKT